MGGGGGGEGGRGEGGAGQGREETGTVQADLFPQGSEHQEQRLGNQMECRMGGGGGGAEVKAQREREKSSRV